MADKTEASGLTSADYAAIEDAVMETARGRWFLAEYARRNRAADTAAVLEAVGRLEQAVGAARPAPEIERIRMDIREMAHAIARTKAEIAAIKPEDENTGRFEEASVELDAIVKATATATGDILGAAETIQEIAWTLREMGTEGEVCDLIDTKATDIYTACSFQDITGQRTRKVIGVLRFLEERIDSMMAIWGESGIAAAPPPPARAAGSSLLNGPARPGEGLGQGDVDMMMSEEELFETLPAPAASVRAPAEPAMAPAAALMPRAEPFPAPAAEVLDREILDREVLGEARATAAAALATAGLPHSPLPRPARPAETAAEPARPAASLPAGLPRIEDLEKLGFIEKVALTS